MKELFFATTLFLVSLSHAAAVQKPLRLVNELAGCEVRLALDANGFSCLTIIDTYNNNILKKSCTDSGWDSEVSPDPRQFINVSTGYQVNHKFINTPQLYFSSWAGGLPHGLPQNFITLKKQLNGFIATEENTFSTRKVFCEKMIEQP